VRITATTIAFVLVHANNMPRRDTDGGPKGGGTHESVESLVDGVLGLEADGPLVVVRNDPAAIAEISDRGRRFVVPHDGHLVDLFDDILRGVGRR
jgi:hypothetical protein